MSESLITQLQGLLGAANVLPGGGEQPAHEVDWRKRYRGRALCVVRPRTTDEVAAVVRACAAAQVSIVPQGGNTGLVGGGVPDESGRQVVLSLQRMNHIRGIDVDNLSMTVDAGCILQQVQESAREAGLLFPLSLAAEGSCTIGGNLATNAGGTAVLRYGNARELCLGLEVVTPHGEIWDGLGGLRKDNTGYDLRDLYVGSEGTLGIITGATLKLHPLPPARATALLSVPSPRAAVDLLNLVRQHFDAGLTGFELMNAFSLALVRRHFPDLPQLLAQAPWTVLLEVVGSDESALREQLESAFGAAMEAGLADDGTVAESLKQSHALWHVRESIPLAQSEEGLNIKHDISVPVSAMPDFVEETGALLAAAFPGMRLVTFGHLGDGNLHYNVQAPEGGNAAVFLASHEEAVNQIVYDEVMRRGGSISAEHGIGALKREELVARKSEVAMATMRAIKHALDPKGLLNPGRVLDV